MATFVHLTRQARVPRLLRSGIALGRAGASGDRGIFATPVTPSFYASHQWLREISGRDGGPIAAVYFRLPDDEPVHVGPYAGPHPQMSAAAAIAVFLGDPPRLGWEVIVPRRISPREIVGSRALRQVVGWRYAPDAHGRPPCPCPHCTRGVYGGHRLRQRLGDGK
jgi:hypothetical protein